jgi:hypothetical protein
MKLHTGLGAAGTPPDFEGTGQGTVGTVGTVGTTTAVKTSLFDRIQDSNFLSILSQNAAQIKPMTDTTNLQIRTPEEPTKNWFEKDDLIKSIPNWATVGSAAVVLGVGIYLLTDEEPKKKKRK